MSRKTSKLQANRPREMTQEFVASKVGVSIVTISNWERGVSAPNARQLSTLANLYGCEMADLM